MKKKLYLLICLIFANTIYNQLLAQEECSPDTNPPVAICEADVTIILDNNGVYTLFPEELDAGSFDNCGDVTLQLHFGDFTPPVDSLVIDFTGTYQIELWVTDESGNINICWTNVIVTGMDCSDDNVTPIVDCFAGLNVNLDENQNFTLYPEDIDGGSFDWCGDVSLQIALEGGGAPSASLDFTEVGDYSVILYVSDESGNTSTCTSIVTVGAYVDCTNDTTPPIAICDDQLIINLPLDGSSALVFAEDFDDGSYDECSTSISYFVNLAGQSTTPPSSTSVEFDAVGTYTAVLWVVDEVGNWNSCLTEVLVQDYCNPDNTAPIAICEADLVVYLDDTGSVEISVDDIDEGSFDWCSAVSLSLSPDGLPSSNTTIVLDQMGTYPIILTATDESGNFNSCFTNVTVLEGDSNCPFIDLSAPFLRICEYNYYSVYYCNPSATTLQDASIEVTLDPFLAYTSSTIPYSETENNVYTFPIGDLESGECGSFKIYFFVDCDAVFGQTHCSDAIIYPNDDCFDNYTGPEIEVIGSCDESNDKVVFTLTNIGETAMLEPLNYLVVEDVIMYAEEEPFQLGVAESIEIELPANGSTYRLEAEQVADFPLHPKVSSTVEGCTTDGAFSLGMVTQFSQFETGSFIAIDCQENIGPYDPNDKQANPRGVTNENLIPKNTSIDYKIRFQNTGTDTAFLVFIRDTLSEWLDPESVRPGASSHDYSFHLFEENIIEFRFENIMLPDSNVNLEGSNGFVQFKIDQLADNPDGTRISNTAAIYFDSNDPVITNEVFHHIGEPIIVPIVDPTNPERPVKVYPNPFTIGTIFEIPNTQSGIIKVYDSQAKLVFQQSYSQASLSLDHSNFSSSGMYFYEIQTAEGNAHRGKLIYTGQ